MNMYRVCFCERVLFFFLLSWHKRKRTKKEKVKSWSLRGYCITVIRRRGYNSLRSNSRPFPAPTGDSAYAPPARLILRNIASLVFFVFLLRSVCSVQMGCTVASLCWFALFSLLKKYAVTLLICFALLLCFFLIQHSFTVVLSVDSLVCLLKKICICLMGLLCYSAPLYCTTVSYSSLLILFSVTALYAFVLSNSSIRFYWFRPHCRGVGGIAVRRR